MTNQDSNEILDTSENRGVGQRVGAVLGKNAPHAGFHKFILILAGLALFAVFFFSSSEEEEENNSSVDANGYSERSTKNGVVPDAIAEAEIKEDQISATKERNSDGSFVGSRPNTGKQSIQDVLASVKKEPAPVPKIEKVEAKPITVFKPKPVLDLNSANNVSRSRNNSKPSNRNQGNLSPVAQYVLDNKSATNGSPSFANGVLISYDAPEPDELSNSNNEQPNNNQAPIANTASGTNASTSDDNTYLAQRAGYFSYAVTITAADTDVAKDTIVAEIIGGQLDGARIIGSWSRLGNFYEDLSLEFGTMEFQGEVYSVNLIAFNSETHLPAFVSEVDRHILYRWGGLLAGGVLEAAQVAALASATIANPEATDTLVNATSDFEGDDIKNIFISEGGSRIASQLAENFNRPITSRVHVNQDMRLLAMKPIYVKK